MGTPIASSSLTFKTRQFYLSGSTDSAKGSTLTFEELDTTLIFLSQSISFVASSSDNAVLTSTITANQTAGAITPGTVLNVGTTFQQFVETLLVNYIPPTITAVLAYSNSAAFSTYTYDVNKLIQIDEVRWSVTNDSPNGNPPQFYGNIGITIDGDFYDAGQTSSPYTVSPIQSIQYNYITNTSISVEGIDDQSNPVSGTRTISFSLRNQFGGYGGPYPTNNSTAQDLFNYLTGSSQTNVFDSDKAFNVTCTSLTQNPANRTYIMYPATYGNLSAIVYNNATSILGAFTKLTGPFTINNGYGHSYSVNIYQSNADGAFVVGDDLTIT